MGYIYALADPKDGRIRYVGKTNQPYTRFKTHLRGDVRPDHPKAKWLQSLKLRGLQPSLVILEEVSNDEMDERERQWIRRIAVTSSDLTNKQLSQSVPANISEESEQYRLLTFMRMHGFDTNTLADALGVSYSMVYMQTRGGRPISAEMKWTFAHRFGWESANAIFDAPRLPVAIAA